MLILIDKIGPRMSEILHGNCLCTSRRFVFEWKKAITYEITSNSNLITNNIPLCASTGPVLVRCCQHLTSTGPVLAHNSMFMGIQLLTQTSQIIVVNVIHYEFITDTENFIQF